MSAETIIALLGALGVGGLLGSVLTRWYEQQKQTAEHDIKIFNQSNEILPEEKLLNIANFGLPDSIKLGDYSILLKWCEFFDKTGNQYLDKQIKGQNKKLHISLLSLTKFIGSNFSEIKYQNPNNENIYLKPEWNPDYENNVVKEQFAERKEYAKELNTLIDKMLNHYSEYRQMVKKKMKI